MFDKLTNRARRVLGLANEEAKGFNHDYIGTEHLLLGLIREGKGIAASALKKMNIDLQALRSEVTKLVKTGSKKSIPNKLPVTIRAMKVLTLSWEEANSSGCDFIGTEHLLLGLLRETSCVAFKALKNMGVETDDVKKEIDSMMAKPKSKKESEKKEKKVQIYSCDELNELQEVINFIEEEKKNAILIQDYENAAQLRDTLKELKKGIKKLIDEFEIVEVLPPYNNMDEDLII